VTAIGMGLAFGAYAIGIWGYCLCRSYDVTFGMLWGPTWGGATGKAAAKSPGKVSPTTRQAELT
jgi:hypothetical protein